MLPDQRVACAVFCGVTVITFKFIEIVWREKIWAGIESYVGFLPKPSLDRARTAEYAGVSLLSGKLGESSGSRVQIPSRPPSILMVEKCCLNKKVAQKKL